jgi:hypothetical protein
MTFLERDVIRNHLAVGVMSFDQLANALNPLLKLLNENRQTIPDNVLKPEDAFQVAVKGA